MRRVAHETDGFRRVLLIEGHRAAMAAERNDVLAQALRRAGLNVELDVVRSLRSTLRVVSGHPDALDRYDAVVVISPTPSSRQIRTAVQELIAERIGDRLPTLLVKVDFGIRGGGATRLEGLSTRREPSSGLATLVLASGAPPDSVLRQIAAALRGVLDKTLDSSTAPLTRPLPPADGLSLSYGMLDGGVLARLDRIAQIAMDGSGMAGATISLLDPARETVFTVSGTGVRMQTRPAESLDVRTALGGVPLILADTWSDAAASRLEVTSGPDAIRFYAGSPIRNAREEPVGALSIHDSQPHDWGMVDQELLHDLALLAEGEIVAALKPSA